MDAADRLLLADVGDATLRKGSRVSFTEVMSGRPIKDWNEAADRLVALCALGFVRQSTGSLGRREWKLTRKGRMAAVLR